MGWWWKHTTQAARTHGTRKGKGDFAEYSAATAAASWYRRRHRARRRSCAQPLRLRLVMRHTVIARLGLRVSLRAGLSGLYRAGKAHIYLHAD